MSPVRVCLCRLSGWAYLCDFAWQRDMFDATSFDKSPAHGSHQIGLPISNMVGCLVGCWFVDCLTGTLVCGLLLWIVQLSCSCCFPLPPFCQCSCLFVFACFSLLPFSFVCLFGWLASWLVGWRVSCMCCIAYCVCGFVSFVVCIGACCNKKQQLLAGCVLITISS